MSGEVRMPPVAAHEDVARFILFGRWIRTSDQTVKKDAFIPPHSLELSVTRHKDISMSELWRIGQTVAAARPATLYGRADLQAKEVRRQRLEIEPRPVANNPNHANITGWPTEKPAQMSLALELAAAARYLPNPTSVRT